MVEEQRTFATHKALWMAITRQYGLMLALTVGLIYWIGYHEWASWFAAPSLGKGLLVTFVVLTLQILVPTLLAKWDYYSVAWEKSTHQKEGEIANLGPTKLETYLVVIIGSIVEELLFRSALQPAVGLWWASIIFGLWHIRYGAPRYMINQWPRFLDILIAGLIWGVALMWTSSMWPLLISHLAHNLLGLLVHSRQNQSAAESASPTRAGVI